MRVQYISLYSNNDIILSARGEGVKKAPKPAFALNESFHSTVRKIGRKFHRCFRLPFFQANWAKNFGLLRVITVHGTMTIKFYMEF